MNRAILTVVTAAALAASLTVQARADVATIDFIGQGTGGSLVVTYDPGTPDPSGRYPTSATITGVSGVFSDLNPGVNIVAAPVVGLYPINPQTPHDAANIGYAPTNFSYVGGGTMTGLPGYSGGFVTYDNLFWPTGSVQTAFDYTDSGGLLDIYGLMFDLGNGLVVDLFSNGNVLPNGKTDYGVAVLDLNQNAALDYIAGGVSVPEPGTLVVLGTGLLGMIASRRRSTRR